MRIGEENWNVLASLFPTGWRQMAWRSRQAGKLERYFGCRFAQTPAQQRGVATFFVCRIVSGERRVSARRSYQPDDPDCGWHDRQRARQDGQPMEDSLQCQTAEFGV